jgi:predicted ATP-grasp superfamily ATP-dependent carboligase
MNVILVGASVRAVAHAAARAGWVPIGFDRYGDRDLAAVASSRAVDGDSFPGAIVDLVGSAPPGPWLYTGPIENHPGLIDQIASSRPLWGNAGESVRAARDPFAVADVLDRAGLPRPDLRSGPEGLPEDGSWLVKPMASAGGIGVRAWAGAATPRPDGAVVYQKKALGLTASMVAACAGGRASIVGLTHQRVGMPGLPFGYAGSIGPLDVSSKTHDLLRRMADVFASSFRLVGLIGIDLVVDDDGVPWPVEINPRIPASAEVLELALRSSLLVDHRQACERGLLPRYAPEAGPGRVVGKAIVTATTRGTVPDLRGWVVPRPSAFQRPGLADVPFPGARFEVGDPVLTVFASGTGRDEVERRLERKAELVRTLLDGRFVGPGPGGSRHVHWI